MAKILEKLLINRINYFLYSNQSLSSKQLGFSPQKSTETALDYLISLVEKQIESKAFILLVSLDIKGAFDNSWWLQTLV